MQHLKMQGTKLGTCEYYNELKKYGFIVVKNDDGSITKFFVHYSQILNDLPKAGSIVRFVAGQIPPGRALPLAEKVVVLRDKVSAETAVSGVN
jgi:cold shock CspA family protein